MSPRGSRVAHRRRAASNLDAPDFTPPFPACHLSHAGFGGAQFETPRTFSRTDEIAAYGDFLYVTASPAHSK
jgi:hypothetical protein